MAYADSMRDFPVTDGHMISKITIQKRRYNSGYYNIIFKDKNDRELLNLRD
jgi:hypothetical protein